MLLHRLFVLLFCCARASLIVNDTDADSYEQQLTSAILAVKNLNRLQTMMQLFDLFNSIPVEELSKSLKRIHSTDLDLELECYVFTGLLYKANNVETVKIVLEELEVTELAKIPTQFSQMLSRVQTDYSTFKPMIEYYVSLGMPLSPVEVFVYSQCGLELTPKSRRPVSVHELKAALPTIKFMGLLMNPEFIRLTIKNFTHDDFYADPAVLLSAAHPRLGQIYAEVDDVDDLWLTAIEEAGIGLGEMTFFPFAVESGYESNLKNVLKRVGDDMEKLPITQNLIMHLAASRMADGSELFQNLFREYLRRFSVRAEDYRSLVRFLMSRPSFQTIYFAQQPYTSGALGKILQGIASNIELRTAFTEALLDNFEGPDKLFTACNVEIGEWLLNMLNAHVPDAEFEVRIRFIIYRGYANTAFKKGRTTLHHVVQKILLRKDKKILSLIKKLVDAGADVNALDDEDRSPIDNVLECTDSPLALDAAIMLIQAGADISHVAEDEHVVLVTRALWEIGFKHILEAMKDEDSNIYQVTDGAYYADVFSKITGH